MTSPAIAKDKAEESVGRFGWGLFTPDSLQRFRSPRWTLAFCCTGSFIQGMIVNGLLHYFVPVIERRFELSSKATGVMSGSYDIASVICLIPITYLGGRRDAHKPKYIGRGIIILGTGSLVFSSPAFLAPPYNQGRQAELCSPTSTATLLEINGNYTFYFILLIIGNLLHGVGASPLYTLAVTFIDESVPMDKASLYLGVYYMMGVVGPFIGIAAGGFLARLDGDVFKITAQSNSDLTPDSPTWVGCWWIGFIACGISCYFFSIPIMGIPKELEGTAKHREERDALHPIASTRSLPSLRTVDGLPRLLVKIITNSRFLFITLGGCCEGMILSGMGAFLTKILQQQFGLSSGATAAVMSITSVPSSLFGIILGGWVIKHFKMNLQQILFMILCLMSLSLFCIPGILISCPNDELVGVTVPYTDDLERSKLPGFKISLTSDCNRDCKCDEAFFSPVCGVDDRMYFSPCLAGCKQKGRSNDIKVFYNCSCISETSPDGYQAEDLPCYIGCPMFPLFIFGIFLYQALAFSTLMPAITSTLRVVETDHRALAMGVQWILARLFGSIPGPILFGAMIDHACVLWHVQHDGMGTCLHYDHNLLGRNLFIIMFCGKSLQIVFFLVAYIRARKRG